MQIKLPSPHAGQLDVIKSNARFKILACGRRWGKTRLGALECMRAALPGGRAWWIAPSYQVAQIGWRLVSRLGSGLPKDFRELRNGDKQLLLANGGEIRVRSADNPDSLRGDSLDYVVFDECAFMKERTWTEVIRPALSDRKGGALFISTPRGRNWFWRQYQRGIDPAYPHYASWQLPTSSNPFMDNAEIELARLQLPEAVFRQEYLAEFIDDATSVFRFIDDAAVATWQEEPTIGHDYIFGVDWGRHNDFTVISVIDLHTNELVHMDRFNQISYEVQVGRLTALAERFNPASIIAEKNSFGEPLIERLLENNLPVVAFHTSNATKTAAIQSLALAFERRELRIVNNSTLLGELKAYEMETTKSGLIRYNAPSGMHDDTVMSLALAWHGADTELSTIF